VPYTVPVIGSGCAKIATRPPSARHDLGDSRLWTQVRPHDQRSVVHHLAARVVAIDGHDYGTATTAFTCTKPRTSSTPEPITWKRECPAGPQRPARPAFALTGAPPPVPSHQSQQPVGGAGEDRDQRPGNWANTTRGATTASTVPTGRDGAR
jgi:hypothetical protein